MSRVITFYNSELFNSYLSYTDSEIEKDRKLFQLVFPDKLTRKEVCYFTSVRDKVIKVTLRMISFLGYSVEAKTWTVTPRRLVVLTEATQEKIGRILGFLVGVGMHRLSSLVFQCVCMTIRNNRNLAEQVIANGYLKIWASTQIRKRNACDLRGLNYNGNSCYQDSTLFALLAVPNTFIRETILKKDVTTVKKLAFCGKTDQEDTDTRRDIQKELIRLKDIMRGRVKGGETCSNLRKLFSRCKLPQRFDLPDPFDAGEFLQFLFSIFDVEGMKTRRTVEVTNDRGSPKNVIKIKDTIQMEAPVFPLTFFSPGTYDLGKMLGSIDDAELGPQDLYRLDGETYSRKIETYTIVSTPYLVFNVQRFVEKVLVDIPERLRDLYLTAIVVHRQNHYTAYLKCGDTWVYYNDNPGGSEFTIKTIGSFENMLNASPRVRSNGTLFFYT